MHAARRALAIAVVGVFVASAAAAAKDYDEVKFDSTGMKKGPRSVENVKANIERLLPRILYLYSEALGPDSTLAGTVLIRMEVDRKGKPGYVDVHESTIQSEELLDLILAALVESMFDEWKDGREKTEILYPIELTPDKAAVAPKSRARRVFEEQQKRKTETQPAKPAEEEEPDEWEQYRVDD